MENDHIILNVDSDNRRIELNLFKESTIIDIIDELIDKKEIIIEKILEIFNDKNNNYEANLVYIDIIGKVFNDNERSVIEKTLKVGMENLLSNIIIEFVDSEKELGLFSIKELFEKDENISNTKYIKHSIRSGIREEYLGSVVLLGDLNSGGQLIASGNIIVFGTLRGLAHAGATGNKRAFVGAKEVENAQVRIADKIIELGLYEENTILSIRDDKIVVEVKEKKDYKRI
ncbi:MAG: septum site-determining protein MinC [Clostridiales bacterium]|jgi:probable septum site-determining protein minC|nr:septum site-determining protein MinC [Clostridiales bacterium]